jgi:ABC-type uncharacterized transport system fused permease/ATPase subunit
MNIYKISSLKRVLKRFLNMFKLILFGKTYLKRHIIKCSVFIVISIVIIKKIKKKISKKNVIYKNKKSLAVDSNNNCVSINDCSVTKSSLSASTPSVNEEFFRQMMYLFKIMFPQIISKATGLVLFQTFALLLRTRISIFVAKLEGRLTRHIVQRNFQMFLKQLIQWILIALPATTCNSLIRYLESKLDLELKSNLIKSCHKHYFENRNYYKIALRNSEKIQIDQNLTGKNMINVLL